MLNADETAVLIIDAQERLSPVMWEADRFQDACSRLIQGARALHLPILVSEHVPDKLGVTVAELAALLPPESVRVQKTRFSVCAEPECRAQIKGLNRRNWLLAGIESHVCVYQTAMDLMGSGYEVEVLGDAVSSRLAENRALGVRRIVQAGGRESGVEMALFELARGANAEQVRALLRLLK